MIKGHNRAHLDEIFEANSVSNDCIFISHKYEDLEAAEKIADYIIDYGINVYLDDRDCKLQTAVEMHNSQKIVSCIEDGVNASTYILVLVTENTRKSWWVPYETGYAKKGKKGIASLLLKEADEFPDYLKIETTLTGFEDLTEFLDSLSVSRIITESSSLNYELNSGRRSAKNRHKASLLRYIRI